MSLRRRRPAQWLTLESNKAIGETIAISITRIAGAPDAAWRVVDGGQIYEYSGDALSHVVVTGPCKIEARIAPKWISELSCHHSNITDIKNIERCIYLVRFSSHANAALEFDVSRLRTSSLITINLSDTLSFGDLSALSGSLGLKYVEFSTSYIIGSIDSINSPLIEEIRLAGLLCAGTQISAWPKVQYCYLRDQSATQARVDAIILDIWQHRASFTYAGGITCNLDGNNAAPSGNVTAPEEGSNWHLDGETWIPLTAGAMVFDLVNDVNLEGFNFWNITVT